MKFVSLYEQSIRLKIYFSVNCKKNNITSLLLTTSLLKNKILNK